LSSPVFHPAALRELEQTWDWYEDREPGLGASFEQAVYAALDTIAAAPEAWTPWPGLPAVRLFILERFPYLIPYCRDSGRIVVLAIAHTSRRSGYWERRVDTTPSIRR
jgi:plasmid stabilization system protein ParE